MRNFHGTTPLIVQNGGASLLCYRRQPTARQSDNEEVGKRIYKTLTDLFTVYNMPVNVDNFYQHFRNGDMPIGIADYATL